jgi:hypothetical protein
MRAQEATPYLRDIMMKMQYSYPRIAQAAMAAMRDVMQGQQPTTFR